MWEGAPEADAKLFRISIEGVKEADSKLSWLERQEKRRAQHGEASLTNDDLRDFTLGLAFGLIRPVKGASAGGAVSGGAAGDGYYLEDADLPEETRRLGKFRDQAFSAYRSRIELQKAWVRKGWSTRLAKLEEDRDSARIKEILDAHAAEMERLVKTADSSGGKPVLDHMKKELAAFADFRSQRGF